MIELRAGVLRDAAGRELADGAGLWAALEAMFASVRAAGGGHLPYPPGWFGYVGYEVGRCVERLPARAQRDTSLPDLRLAFHDAVLVRDRRTGRAWLAEVAVRGGRGAAERLVQLARAAADLPADGGEAIAATNPQAGPETPSNFTRAQYLDAVARGREHIAAGDIFQVNLSQRFEPPGSPPARRLYRALRRRNPAAYAGYLSFGTPEAPRAVLSSSPELFLRLRGREVVTRPIKGTCGRTGDDRADARAAERLGASEKDNAELAMIVDLLRNDLGRVCEYGTVDVPERRRLEAHPTVFHLVATVAGRLREGVGPAELLRATFPGGSITGAPKIRAMEIIDELEPVARGVYTGCIGTVGIDGSATWNIAIRTIVRDGERTLVQVGGGIVADSDPAAEYDETLDKARGMLAAVADAR